MEVVPENAVPVLHKEQVEYEAKKADWRRRSGGEPEVAEMSGAKFQN